ncbi:hypothetical protein PVK06_008155 [Gossypium arboreum]|uniref:Uncharacterized protein n=1 Tax=Gossypium arboreum TaxID=29729 RepID=A0ABR0QJY5_GOSAR|nr:hypothetical protein PVK06_008155 [Gossypium arboreum]
MGNQDVRLVEDFINPNTRRWKIDTILNIFNKRDAERILKIPLLQYLSDDHITWRGEASGEYYIHNGYKLIIQGLTNSTARQEQGIKGNERSGNKTAHAIAQEGLSRGEDGYWVGDAPALVEAAAAEDCSLHEPP